jgi:DNA-binding transcriptional ArsR family regulator
MSQHARPALSAVVDAVKALGHPGRLRILAMLRSGDLCVCQVTAALGLATSTVSSHLSDLRRAGFVTERKTGKWVRYQLVCDSVLADLAGHALRLADADGQLEADRKTVRALRTIPIETLCRTGVGAKAPRPTLKPRVNRPRNRRTS